MERRIAYVNYGEQSGVTTQVARALLDKGNEVVLVDATGEFDLRDRGTRRPRATPAVLLHLAYAAARFRGRGLAHRFNTPFAFDRHSRRAGEALLALRPSPDLVLQNGALFAPGCPPLFPYALLIDHTRALGMRVRPFPEAGLQPPLDYGPEWEERETRTYRGASAIATFSQNAARSLVEDYGVARERVRVVGAGPNIYPEEPVRDDDGRTVLFVGREFVRKGGKVLLEAFSQVRSRLPGARLLVAGPPTLEGAPPYVEHLGAVSYSALPALFARATVFALPTLQEPFGIAFLDAMACAVPCVGTAIEAIPEIVGHGETGLLVPPGNAPALADALIALLGDRQRARKMGENGRERVAKRFLWSHVGERLESLFAFACPTPAQATPGTRPG